MHGLRHTAGRVLLEIDCEEKTIGAILGHRTLEMVRRYTAQRRRAESAIASLDRAHRERSDNAPD